jgi:hypothetical protein
MSFLRNLSTKSYKNHFALVSDYQKKRIQIPVLELLIP